MPVKPPATGVPAYWFPAKRFGWGWGLPARWQGGVVSAVWLTAVILGGVLIAPSHLVLYFPYMIVITGLLIGVCYLTGEPPRWR